MVEIETYTIANSLMDWNKQEITGGAREIFADYIWKEGRHCGNEIWWRELVRLDGSELKVLVNFMYVHKSPHSGNSVLFRRLNPADDHHSMSRGTSFEDWLPLINPLNKANSYDVYEQDNTQGDDKPKTN